MNENLLRNKETWESIIAKIEERYVWKNLNSILLGKIKIKKCCDLGREKEALRVKDDKIQELEAQV